MIEELTPKNIVTRIGNILLRPSEPKTVQTETEGILTYSVTGNTEKDHIFLNITNPQGLLLRGIEIQGLYTIVTIGSETYQGDLTVPNVQDAALQIIIEFEQVYNRGRYFGDLG